MSQIYFRDRSDAGIQLANLLVDLKGSDSIVLSIPRGGVPVGHEIAKALNLPLEIILSKKIAYTDNEEYALGAVSADAVVLNEDINTSDAYIRKEAERLRKILRQKYSLFDSHLNEIDLTNKTIILVDDGIATGSTLMACIETLRKKNPKAIIVATPIVPAERIQMFENAADQFIYLNAPSCFSSVGSFYETFDQVEDSQVKQILQSYR